VPETAGFVFVDDSRCERERVCRPEDETPCPTCVREFVRFGVRSAVTDSTPDTAGSAGQDRITTTAAQTMPGPRRNDPRQPVWASVTVEVSLWDLHIALSAARSTFEEMRDLGNVAGVLSHG
jgi:hypothetical protein